MVTKQGKHPEKAGAILQAATELFAEKDFHAVLMEEVALRAGVGKGTLYRYFPTKDKLYVSTIVIGWDRLREELEKQKVAVSVRGTAVRVAPHVYNDEHDVEALLDALRAVAEVAV